MAIARAVDSFQRRMAALEAKSWINNKLPDSGIIFPVGQAADYAPPLFRSITLAAFGGSHCTPNPSRRAVTFGSGSTLMLIRSRLLAASTFSLITLTALGAYSHWASAKLPDAFAGLAGRWSGTGIVKPASGPAESFKCVVTYLPDGSSARLRQNLRCRSNSYQLDAATHLELNGSRVTGRWQDNIYTGLSGTVSGTIKDGGFDVVLSGQFFTAQMTVVGNRCEQSVTVKPQRADYIREVSASLKKC